MVALVARLRWRLALVARTAGLRRTQAVRVARFLSRLVLARLARPLALAARLEHSRLRLRSAVLAAQRQVLVALARISL
jgi:hypothetical protein